MNPALIEFLAIVIATPACAKYARYRIRADKVRWAYRQLQYEFTKFFTHVGEALLPVFRQITEAANQMGKALKPLIDKIGELNVPPVPSRMRPRSTPPEQG